MIGGVCGGLAEYTGIDALLWRVGFVALALFGGSGVLVYLLLWLLVPAGPGGAGQPDGPGRPVRPAGPRSPVPGITVALLLIVLGVLALVTRFTPLEPGPRGFVGAALLVVGVGLVISAFGEGRRAPRGGLIVLGIVLSIALLLISSTPWHGVGAGVGDRVYRPSTAAQVQPDYRGGVGDTTLDLRQVDLSGLTAPITTRIDHGVGDLRVIVPGSADVRVTVHSGLGSVDVFGQSADSGFYPGTGADAWTNDGRPEFDLTINAGIGDVEVSRG